MGIKGLRGSLRKKDEPEKELPTFMVSPGGGIIDIPDVPVKEMNFSYTLIEPYANVRIRWDDKSGGLIYELIEPELTDDEKKTFEVIMKGLIELVEIQLTKVESATKAMEYLEEKVHLIIKEIDLDISKLSYNKIMYFVYRNFVGLNRMEPLMEDPYIEDIGCVGYGVPVYVIHKKFGSIPTNIVYNDEDELKEFIIKMAERAGRYISYAEPLLDGALPDGSRVQASLAQDVTTKGPTFSIRKFSEDPVSPIGLMELGTVSADLLAYLWFVIENGVSALICGGTATGKTTILNAISMFIPTEDKIVSIEDTRELSLSHNNWIPAVARTGFGSPTGGGEKYGSVDMYELLRESFRQNPDYVIVGEIRGKEAYVMFQGMASGHPSIGTMHAAGVETVIKRLSSPPIELSPSLIEILDIVITMVHAQERGKSARRVKNITEIRSVDDVGNAKTSVVYRWIPSMDTFEKGEGKFTIERISGSKGLDLSTIDVELKKRAKVLQKLFDKKVSKWEDVVTIVTEYRKNPSKVMKDLGIE